MRILMLAIAAVGAFVFRTASAVVLWDEAISGDLSNNSGLTNGIRGSSEYYVHSCRHDRTR
jgi:hypothetical protein